VIVIVVVVVITVVIVALVLLPPFPVLALLSSPAAFVLAMLTMRFCLPCGVVAGL